MFPWRENRLLRRALSLYAGDHVLDHVVRNGEQAFARQTRTCELTLLFVDVAAFSQPDERLGPKDLDGLIDSWFEALTDGIVKHNGTVDTYVGDATSAWWGSNGESAHAHMACGCAKDLVAQVARLNQDNHSKGWPELKPAIGINTGVVRLGPYGSSKRLRYSAFGDAVNLASRLCGLANRHYPHPIVVSEHTQKLLGAETQSTLLDTVTIKGLEAPVSLYAI